MWTLGIIHASGTYVKHKLSSEKRFVSPRKGPNPQPSDDWWDALTTELPKLRWRAMVRVQHMWCLCSSYDMLIIPLKDNNNYVNSSNEVNNSEGCGFDPRLGLRNHFSEDNLRLTNVLRTPMYTSKLPNSLYQSTLLDLGNRNNTRHRTLFVISQYGSSYHNI